ncbi:response regulator [Cupriavidus pauculus]|uniref:response regulator n=1 Tax=Cupriavidus pauculus TaxID=82633 RepID=UPI0026AA53AF|nr:response regulator [Cupriavidus pauculus]
MTKTGLRVASLENDSAQAAMIRAIVTGAGHECVTFTDGRRMLLTLRKVAFDLLLDWDVPQVSGLEVLHWVRTHLDPRLPVMFVARRQAEADIAAALAAGPTTTWSSRSGRWNCPRASRRCCDGSIPICASATNTA